MVTFALFQLGPALSHTSPVYYYIGRVPFPKGSTQLKLLEHRFGFDLPFWQQYLHFMKGILFGAEHHRWSEQADPLLRAVLRLLIPAERTRRHPAAAGRSRSASACALAQPSCGWSAA